MTTPIFSAYGGFRKTFSFAYTCLIYHATTLFCNRNFNHTNDPLGKTSGQMIGAARSARQNIVEGSSRAGTSRETELRLYDVARGSLEELAGDFETFLIDRNVVPWAKDEEARLGLESMHLDRYEGDSQENARHDHCKYILAMRSRFERWLESKNAIEAANSILIIIDHACRLLHRQMESIGKDFENNGGFSERLSKIRLETRDSQQAANGAPQCPICGKPMRKITARKGRNAGRQFWSCTDYPNCTGTRNIDDNDNCL